MSALGTPSPAAPRILADRPRAARRRHAQDGALTEFARSLTRDARAAESAAERLAARPGACARARTVPVAHRRAPGRQRLRPAAAPLASA